MIEVVPALRLLAGWAHFALRTDFTRHPQRTEWGIYGTGYNNWGVQTQQKFVAALAVTAEHPAAAEVLAPAERDHVRRAALQAMRYTLDTHLSGAGQLTDGRQWGHTWISALGLERMMFGVAALEPHLTADDRAGLDRVLASEADWLARRHVRGHATGVTAGRWAREGRNAPESNLWNGALLWRTAERLPSHPDNALWREMAHRFLVNGVSVAADRQDSTMVAGRAVRDWTVGDNFFPAYGLDHHGYLNVGYMAICVSNAALLHFDLKQAGHPRPESLDHHQADLWRVLRAMVFDDGRLARIGGDTRVRYCYCQDYLLPALLYAADRLGDGAAPDLARSHIALMAREAEYNGDGGFLSRRLAPLRAESLYYYCRLESDRACALAMAAWHAARVDAPAPGGSAFPSRQAPVAWSEPEHGAVLHRCPTRLAAFAWRAHGLTQGLCLPPAFGDLAEWEQNLAGRVEFQGRLATRDLQSQQIRTFDGGFLTSGELHEGARVEINEGWQGGPLAVHRLVFCALPDGHTVIGLQLCRTLAPRVYPRWLGGMQLHCPNDLYNNMARELTTARGQTQLTSPPAQAELRPLGSVFAGIDDRIGVCGLYGADSLWLERHPHRRGGAFAALYLDSLYWGVDPAPAARWSGETLLDCGWATLASIGAQELAAFAGAHTAVDLRAELGPMATEKGWRRVAVTGRDGRRYVLTAALGDAVLPGDIPEGALAATDRAVLHTVDGN